MRRLAASLDGVAIAYLLAVANGLLELLLAFGVTISDRQQAAVILVVNAALVAVAHLAHREGQQSTQATGAPPAAVEPPTTTSPPPVG